ncbi:MAG: hypothetical protein A3F72_04265 [Bacteroidetes bacterium RIFCSPLOWO2_12_FULL_35_15]|nr:MAG: hypothetical protein A3F72_04265 [Bacteroidetes bacterium RIFCSPLOWO2_12_FULL_35_15]
MEIVPIFEEKLFSFHYENERDNEFDRLMELWTDAGFLQGYAKKNSIKNVYGFIEDILQNAEEIQDYLDNLNQNKSPYGFYFEPLQESERKKQILSFQKGKIKKNQLRLYAIKIDDDCFVITGGAIKMSQRMDEHPDTAKELVKLNDARKYLKTNGVTDIDSFYELLSE